MKQVLLCDTVRTPIGRYGGSLARTRADDLAAAPIVELMSRHPNVDWARVDDVVLGCANQAGDDNRNVARMASLLAGLPVSVTGTTVNRLCGSGMDALAIASRQIEADEADLLIAGGVESMSRAPFVVPKSDAAFSRSAEMADTTIGWRLINPRMEELYGTHSMPETAENVADEDGVSRVDQDAFAARSQKRAAAAREKGLFAEEIVSVSVPVGKRNTVQFVEDEHLRPETTETALSQLRPLVRSDGTITAGNSSGVNDGAAACLLTNERLSDKFGLEPIARIRAFATVGVPPRVMGLGPAPAVQKLIERTGVSLRDIDVIEINEAFAAQALASMRRLGLADNAEHVNPNGGAIALGHPLGMSGARITMTAARELKRRGGRYAIAAMCIGVGQGIAVLLEKP